jgi:hypothetical protein
MSNLNNFMKNNKGYYSWIHSMKQAAVESHLKGRKMLSEQKEKGEEYFKEVGKALVRPGEAPVVHPDYPEEASMTSAQTYEKIKAEKMARGEGRNLKRTRGGENDVVPAGDANAVHADAQDGVMGDEGDEGEPITLGSVKPSAKPGKTSPIAARARVEAGYALPGDKEIVDADEREYMDSLEPPARYREIARPDGKIGLEDMDESINSKIKRIISEMRGEEPVRDLPARGERGTMKTGQSGESAGLLGQRLPTDLINKIEPTQRNPQGIIKHLIQVIENPNEHPAHHYKIANEIFSAMGEVYKK